jgi:FtsP/CotA-like multicopper oxidase with cupredoxin domain
MKLRKALKIGILALALIAMMGEVGRGLAQSQTAGGTVSSEQTKGRRRGTTMVQRNAAAANAAAARAEAVGLGKRLTMAVPVPGGTPDYFGIYPNYANSPLPTVGAGGVITGGIRKFVDSLPGLGPTYANNLGQYIPVAQKITPPAGVPNDGDYYEIGVFDYTQQMHSDLPATKLRGYRDLAPGAAARPYYLGPLIIAKRHVPVRIKFSNMLAPNSSFFLPVDTTTMGAGLGPLGAGAGNYSNNRATLHLHGGDTPWISDGTPHQWVVPPGESTSYTQGLSTQLVPDMPNPGPGAMTFYYPNGQSARLLFYHDHSYGVTRLNVYAGEAAGYLLTDDTEESLINTGVLPNMGGVYRYGVPLIIQDKTFVPPPAQLAAEDPTWNWGGTGNLWFPHVYMPNQYPYVDSGANAMGRWDYGPWFWPPFTGLVHGPVPNPYFPGVGQPPTIPGTPNPTMVPEAFMDTPLVNGTPYPYVTVGQQAIRFRILNACNDRSLNLQLYYADPTLSSGAPGFGKEVKMVPAVATPGYPDTWPTDGRDGGVPDPATAGPPIIQIGTEGGFLPAPVVIPSTPIGYNYNRRDIVVLNISTHSLLLGPAERADVIIDFSGVPVGSKLILYNDAPAPVPAFDSRNDYYTGDPDQTSTGGAPTTLPGYGPNTRTMMQIRVVPGSSGGWTPAALQTALPAAFAASQPAPIVPEPEYGPAYGKTYQENYARIQDMSFTFAPDASSPSTTFSLKPKAIQELFEPNYGRMNAILGVEIPNTNITNQTTIPYYYVDPPTEIIAGSNPASAIGSAADGTQIWKVTHNGVDTHAVHFHLFNVQLINRVGWDGAIRPPDANELGWKETVRMNPLEDAIVALRPIRPVTPFPVPNSIRPLDVTAALGTSMNFTNVDPDGNSATVTNVLMNFGWEYIWHCHLLGHEENDMMRPVIFAVPPVAPTSLVLAADPAGVKLTWVDNSTTETGFTIQRSASNAFPASGLTEFLVGPNVTSYIDTTNSSLTAFYYRVLATTGLGNVSLLPGSYPGMTTASVPSNIVPAGLPVVTTASITAITGIGATGGGTVVADGGYSVTARGICWSTSANPTTANSKTADGSGTGTFTSSITGLSALTLYHVRAYATNSAGTSYGDDLTFRTVALGTGGNIRVDFNNDGKEDILWRNASTGQNAIWFLGQATAGIAAASQGTFGGKTLNGEQTAAFADIMAGWPEVPATVASMTFDPAKALKGGVRQAPWEPTMRQGGSAAPQAPMSSTPMNGVHVQSLPMTGFTYFTSITDLSWKIVGTGDFNGDGKIDILWRNLATGQNAVWYMNGSAYAGYVYLPAVTDLNWTIVSTGDFNGDGKVDILWRNTSTGQNAVWYMNGVFNTGYTYILAMSDLNWKIVGTGDFNGDGKPDIVWRNSSTGENGVWYMNGTIYDGYDYLYTVTDPNWQIVGVGDFNQDGKHDLVWRHAGTGQNLVWLMNGVNYIGYSTMDVVIDLNWQIFNR